MLQAKIITLNSKDNLRQDSPYKVINAENLQVIQQIATTKKDDTRHLVLIENLDYYKSKKDLTKESLEVDANFRRIIDILEEYSVNPKVKEIATSLIDKLKFYA